MKLCYHCMQQIRGKRLSLCPNCGRKLNIQQVPVSFLNPGTVLQDRFILGYPLGSGGFQGVIKLLNPGTAKYETASTGKRSEAVLKDGYAPIEQYSRVAEEGTYTDLYAAAAVLYRMLTGQKPIPAIERIQQDGLIPPSEMGIEIPRQAEMGMMVCLNIRPEHRLQSADEFMDTLDGKDFIPIYEPKWILPPEEKGGGFFKKISRLLVAAKARICFVSICLIFGIVGERYH